MAKTHKQRPSTTRSGMFRITKGALGPVGKCELEIRPLTVFVGRQGTGKSLVSQVLYFFEELPFLANYVQATSRKKLGPELLVRTILDRLRSHERAFGAFASPNVTIEWERSANAGEDRQRLGFSVYSATRAVNPNKLLKAAVAKHLQRGSKPMRRAVFFPTERLVISQLRSAIAENVLSLPITYTLFSEWIDLATRLVSSWKPGEVSPQATYVAERGAMALGGEVVRRGDQWKWRFGPKSRKVFDLDLASSGQRANWSIFYLAQALFELRETDKVAEHTTVFVEEPEIHLHPAAQVVVAEVLAFLVRQGFRVVLTTHSMNVVYALNNLIQASRLGDRVVKGAPAPSLRLSPDDVAVYAFGDGAPRSLVDRATGFIDETALGSVAEELTVTMNTIGANLPVEG